MSKDGSDIWQDPLFEDTQSNFDRMAHQIGIDENIIKRLRIPEKALVVSVPFRMDNGEVQMATGYRVQHNHALGPCKGGIRYHPDVNLGEVAALSMMMTWKCAIAGIPLGGAKGAVTVDPTPLSRQELQRITRRYTLEICSMIGPAKDIPAPDMGTSDQVMAWMMDTYSHHAGHTVPGVVTGKPIGLGGSLGRKYAPGHGVAYCVEEAAHKLKIPINKNFKVAIQGFGQVGSGAFETFEEMDCSVIAVSDVSGGIYNPKGFCLGDLRQYIEENKVLKGYPDADEISNDELLAIECDVLVPAALGRVIHKDNVGKLKCKILAEGANGPVTEEANTILREQDDIFVIPDILANAGGVIVSYFEWVQGLQSYFWSATEVKKKLKGIISQSFNQVFETSIQEKWDMRSAALATAIRKIEYAMLTRGLFP